MALLAPWEAKAQKSASCSGTSPCVRVGLEDLQHPGVFESDAGHFLYCGEGQTVSVEVLAKFNSPVLCNCGHTPMPRDWTWSWQGAGTSTPVTSVSVIDDATQLASIELLGAQAGDTITVTCTVENIAGGDCYEDHRGRMGTHDNARHAGATASCTIKLWRMDMEVTGGNAEQDSNFPFIYDTTFAESPTTTATLVGATAAAPSQTIVPWEWKSIELDEYEILNTMEGSNSWDGTIVASTAVEVKTIVVNKCDPATYSSTSDYVIVKPSKRRSGWEMSASHGGEDENWKSDKPNGFPVIDMGDFGAWAQNTNSDSTYQDHNQVIVTPVYSGTAVPSNLYATFTEVREKILDGPNFNLWYLTDPALFTAARKSRVNFWITPGAGKPGSVPALGPQGISYSSWSNIYTVLGTDTCACNNPSSHDGVGGNIRYKANIWHEGYGCPSSANQVEIGHQARLENAVDNGSRSTYDAVWKCDLVYSKSEGGLLASAESARFSASEALKTEMLKVHTFVTNEPEKHNFRGIMWITDGTTWSTDGSVSTY